MIKTGNEIRTDIYNLIAGSTLASSVNGQVYFDGTRPRDSKKEDIIVIFTTGFTDQIQEGTVSVNIYVPDIQYTSGGVLVEDIGRTNTISRAAQNWVDSLKARYIEYQFKLRMAISTGEEPEINQHFVHVRLGYRLYNG